MEVRFAIHDLSNGMARNLSAQFLGPNHVLEMFPHTGLLCFGKEYFFGGGIQAVDPNLFRRSRGIEPCQIQSLGVTEISKSEFEAWCQGSGQCKFNINSYDLLSRNCNNFSHEAALNGLKLLRGVPEWILSVPQRFLSSPMGMMIRPLLEEMQITQMAPFQGSVDTQYTTVRLQLTSSLQMASPASPSTAMLRLIVLKYAEGTVDCMEWLFGATLFPDTWKTPTTRSLA
ncbi:unnamed protein product [Cylindrotheca closterium]|uniref:PPPDE domain-containing protein n=1 Tax=Cylindrotheca closterium TaxID=2856 RepID=A0AAD2PVP9_9STRA|nr:unnamed protein product [Cylindrotheca closterium]